MSSRELRKLQSPLDNRKGSTWWAPGAVGWWIGVLFAFGATFFALGAAPGYVKAVGNATDGLTYFIGSIFFTTAALLQFLESAFAPVSDETAQAGHSRRVRPFRPLDLAWLASLIQLAGTIYFNFSTYSAMTTNLSAASADHLVWKPDIFGSICFLIASSLAWYEFNRSFFSWRPGNLSWWIVFLNLLGSVGFGISAVAAYVVPTTGSDVNKMLVNLGTFVGALCFQVAAVMLLPERTRKRLD